MADIYAKEQRSKIMSKISGKETKPEILVRQYLFSHGLRFRKNVESLPGKPDIVLPKYKVIILVHGCYWHGHKNCKAAKLPKTRKAFWKKKIFENISRDQKQIGKLENMGWHVIVLWQCEINTKMKQRKRLSALVDEILQQGNN